MGGWQLGICGTRRLACCRWHTMLPLPLAVARRWRRLRRVLSQIDMFMHTNVLVVHRALSRPEQGARRANAPPGCPSEPLRYPRRCTSVAPVNHAASVLSPDPAAAAAARCTSQASGERFCGRQYSLPRCSKLGDR